MSATGKSSDQGCQYRTGKQEMNKEPYPASGFTAYHLCMDKGNDKPCGWRIGNYHLNTDT